MYFVNILFIFRFFTVILKFNLNKHPFPEVHSQRATSGNNSNQSNLHRHHLSTNWQTWRNTVSGSTRGTIDLCVCNGNRSLVAECDKSNSRTFSHFTGPLPNNKTIGDLIPNIYKWGTLPIFCKKLDNTVILK